MITGLGLEYDEYKAAMYNHSGSIQAATHKLLRKWLQDRTDRHEAYKNIQVGLRRCKRTQLAVILKDWVEGPSAETHTYEDSKYFSKKKTLRPRLYL